MLKFWPLIEANLRRRPARTVLAFVATLLAFSLYGLALGEAVGFAHAAAARHVNIGRGFLLVAMAASAAGMVLILFLTTSAMAQATRLRIGEFGVLKAIGFSHGLILALVTAEAALPCVAGAMGGLLAAKLLYILLTTLLPPLAVFPPLIYTPSMLALAGLLALTIGCVSGALPATRIIRLEAAEALAGALRPTAPSHEVHAAAQPQSTPAPVATQADLTFRAVVKGNPHPFRQILVVTCIGLSTLPHRLKGAAVVVVGVGAMAFALLSILSLMEGISSAILDSGDPSRAVIHEVNHYESGFLRNSVVPGNSDALAAAAPGVEHAKNGAALVDAEFFRSVGFVKRNDGETGRIFLMGTGPHWREMTPSFRLLSGRLPRPGTHELIAGTLAARKFSGLDAGFVDYNGLRWPIVGSFRSGKWWDGYLVGNAAVLKAANQSSVDTLVRVQLSSAGAFDSFQRYVAARMPANVIVERENDYYAHYWDMLPHVAIYVAYVLGMIVGAGALAATTQTMHGAVEERAREIAVLRALGFNGLAAAASVVIEAMVLAALGAFLGTALVWLWLDGFLYNGAVSVFRITVDLHLLLVAMGWGMAIAIPGTLTPAFRLARQTPIEALREVQRCPLRFCPASPPGRQSVGLVEKHQGRLGTVVYQDFYCIWLEYIENAGLALNRDLTALP